MDSESVPSTAGGISAHVQESILACSKAFDSEDFTKSDKAIADFISVIESALDSYAVANQALNVVLDYISSPTSNQTLVEAIGLELPKVVARFTEVSNECAQTAYRIVEHLVSVCSPRDMLSILCEALDTHVKTSGDPLSLILLLRGLSKVFPRIQRRQIEQIKVALPVVLNVINFMSSETDDEDDSLKDLFHVAVSIGESIQSICQNMEGSQNEEMCGILGLYVLQNMALISRCVQKHDITNYIIFVKGFSEFIPFCSLSYLGLITGSDVNRIEERIFQGKDDDDFQMWFSFASSGASLSVIWGYISEEVAKAAGEQLNILVKELQSNIFRRWAALGMLKDILSSIDFPWEIKFRTIELISRLMHGRVPEDDNEKHKEFSSFLPNIFAALQAIQRIIMTSPSASSRKEAFDVFRKVLSDIPDAERVDMLKALILNSSSPSMTAILIDIAKEEIRNVYNEKANYSIENETMALPTTSLVWTGKVLDIVEMVLRPAKGGAPTLPEDCDPVIAALNLFRFVLLAESKGKTNFTGILSKNTLQKAYDEWLMPLRMLVLGIELQNKNNINNELADSIQCTLNPLEVVLYRCIELIEQELKSC